MIRLLILLAVLCSDYLSAQEFSEKYFRTTEWFASNKDSALLTSDTVRIIRYPETDESRSTVELRYLGHGDFAVLHFFKRHRLEYSERYSNYITCAFTADFAWEYDKRTNVLSITKASEPFLNLKPVRTNAVALRYGSDTLSTIELVCIRQR